MLSLARLKTKGRRAAAAESPFGVVQFHATGTLWSALQTVAGRWQCGLDVATRRLLVMAMSGWKLNYADRLAELSRYVKNHDDPFQRTCLILRNWLATWTTATGESLTEADVEARLAMLADALRERRESGQCHDLAAILSDDPEG